MSGDWKEICYSSYRGVPGTAQGRPGHRRQTTLLEKRHNALTQRMERLVELHLGNTVDKSFSEQAIRCDNGPELTSRHMLAWCVERQKFIAHSLAKHGHLIAQLEEADNECVTTKNALSGGSGGRYI